MSKEMSFTSCSHEHGPTVEKSLPMILNAYAVLSGFVVVLRGIAAVLVIGLACCVLRSRRRVEFSPTERTESENRFYLLSLLSTWLLGLSLISWPLLYLLLQSYVPHWPGVMCIYGVTQIGAGSRGSSRFLPGLIVALQFLKPAAVFVSGVWWLLYRIQRQTQTEPLMGRILLVQLGFGVLALTDTLLEGVYLVIPKREEFLFTGCCTSDISYQSDRSISWLASLSDGLGPKWLSFTFYVVNFGLVFALWCFRIRSRQFEKSPGMNLLLLGAVLVAPLTAAYLAEIAAPAVLRLPYHHCLYDLIPRAIDMVLGIVLYVMGAGCVGWACAVRWLAVRPETKDLARSDQDWLLSVGLNCYVAALVMFFLEVSLA